MNLILVDNLIVPEEGSMADMDVHPHLGLLALAAAAGAHGHRVTIYDPKRLIRSRRLTLDANLYERVATDLLRERPDAVGFTTLGCSFIFAVNVAACLKRAEPDLPIMLGGPHATMLHRQILERFGQFDLVARHECDEVFPSILAALSTRDFSHIPGLSWRERRGLRFTEGSPKVTDLDSLPLFNYDLYPVRELELDMLRIEAGRGCPFACTFCSTAGFFQRSFRLKSPERLVLELDRLHERFGVTDFKLDHDMFTVNRHKVHEFCEAVADRRYSWRASARVDCVDVPLLRSMADAGCVHLYFGIETGSARMQRETKKNLDLELVEAMLSTAQDMGIDTTASFITGYPQESLKDQNDTLNMIGKLSSPRCLTQLHVLVPEPGTPMLEQFKDALRYDGIFGPYNAQLLTSEDEALIQAETGIFQTYHYYAAELPRARHLFASAAVATLRCLGPTVLEYLLRAYAGQLSQLIADWESSQNPVDGGAASCLTYLRQRFGERHHIVSLARYALSLTAGGTEDDVDEAADAPDLTLNAARPLMVSSALVTLSDIHDCEAVMAAIGAQRNAPCLMADANFPDRCSYLVLGSAATRKVWRVDHALLDLLDFFRAPRRLQDVLRLLQRDTDKPDLSLFAGLLQQGILRPAHDSVLETASLELG